MRDKFVRGGESYEREIDVNEMRCGMSDGAENRKRDAMYRYTACVGRECVHERGGEF